MKKPLVTRDNVPVMVWHSVFAMSLKTSGRSSNANCIPQILLTLFVNGIARSLFQSIVIWLVLSIQSPSLSHAALSESVVPRPKLERPLLRPWVKCLILTPC